MEPVSDDEMTALRAMLAGDFETMDAAFQRLGLVDEVRPFSVLIVLALQMAAREHFNRPYTTGEIIGYVAELRAAEPDMEIDARTAEKLMLGMLSNDPWQNDLVPEQQSVAQAALLDKLVTDQHLDDAELEDFLRNARRLTDDWITRYGDQATAHR